MIDSRQINQKCRISRKRKYAALAIIETLSLVTSVFVFKILDNEPISQKICGQTIRKIWRGGGDPILLQPHQISQGEHPPPAPSASILPPMAPPSLQSADREPSFLAQVATGCTHGVIVRVIPDSQLETLKIIHAPDGTIIAFSLLYAGRGSPTVYLYRNGKAVGEVTEPTIPARK